MGDRDIQIIIQAVDKTGSAIASINKNLGWLGGSITKLSVQFSAMSTSVQAVWAGLQKAFEFAEMGAKAQQVEESFRAVAASAGESSDRIIAAMKEASAGTIDDTDLMQKAVKGITQGLKGDDLVKLAEGARIAARATGDDITTAFDKIVDAVANKTPRALQQMGLVTKEQMNLFNQEVSAGVEVVSLLDLAVANITIRQAQHGVVLGDSLESFKRFRAELKAIKDTLSTWFLTALQKVYGGFLWIASGAMAAVAYVVKFVSYLDKIEAWSHRVTGKKREADEASRAGASKQEIYEALKRASEDLAGKAMDTWTNANPAAAVADGTRKSLPDAMAAMDALTQKMREAIEKSKIKPGKATTAKEEKEIQIYDTEKGVKAYQEYEQSLTEIKSTETEKRLAKTEEWANREYGLLKVAYANNVIGEKEYSDRLLGVQSEAEKQKLQIKLEAQAEAAEIQRKAQEEELKAQEDYRTQYGTVWEGIVEGVKKYQEELEKTFITGKAVVSQVTSGMESAFSSFFDTTSEKFMDFGELAKNILQSIYMSIMQNLVVKQLVGGIMGGLFHEGGVVMHQGGMVMHAGGLVGRSGSGGGYVPRYHVGGLSGDERPAILQTGEGVLSRRGMANLGALNGGMAGGGGNVNVVINLENESGTPVKAEQSGVKFDGESYIVGVVLKNIDSYGSLRHAIQGVK
jgi:hypothetical protein